jgi:hypothetical protein
MPGAASTDSSDAAPASPSPPTAALSGESENRYLVGNLPASAHENETVELTVRVSTDAPSGRSDKLELQVPPEGALLDIVVTAPNFQLDGPATTKLFVPPTGDSGFVMFRLRALRSDLENAEAQVHVAAVYRGTNVAALTLSISITAAAPAPQQRKAERRSKLSANGARAGDVSLFINFHKPSKTYSFQWFDAEGGSQEPAYTELVFQDLVESIRNTASQIDEIARLDYNVDLETARTKLETSGTALWELLPDEIRSRLIDQWDKFDRLNVYSDVDPVPWEMLYPFRKKPHFDGGQFLVEKAQICRWRNGSLPPGMIGLDRADFVVADPAQLKQAGEEVLLIKQALAQWNAALAAGTISAANELHQLFRQDLLNLLHVACHQSFESDNERIKIANTIIGPTEFNNYQLTALPFIFMNACRSDSKVPAYNKIGGWANTFLGIGAGAFIGTLWEVRDTTAQLFANTLYDELLQHRSTFGDALKRARAAVKQKAPGDPTWLAYTFYGDTEARFGVGP